MLYDAYANSLILAKENECSSIAFPVISSGIYGYPVKEAWQVAVKSCMDFTDENPEYPISITFAVLSGKSKGLGESVLCEMTETPL